MKEQTTKKIFQTLGQKLYDTTEQHHRDMSGVASGDLVNTFGPGYMKELQKAIEEHSHIKEKFYIQVISKHLIFAPTRGLRLYFVGRLSKPRMKADQDLWSYEPKTGKRQLEWSLPHRLEMRNFLISPEKYSPKIIADIRAYRCEISRH